jgi:Flp pilus assembly protein TadB
MHRVRTLPRWFIGVSIALLLLAGIVAVWYAPWWFWLLLLGLLLLGGTAGYARAHMQHRRRYEQRRARRRQSSLPERVRRPNETERLLHELLDEEPPRASEQR